MKRIAIAVVLTLTATLRAKPQHRESLPAATGSTARASRVIDAVVASVGNSAITLSDVQAEYRIEYFLENKRTPPNPPDRTTIERIRDHLIDQRLLAEEPAAADIDVASLERSARQRLARIQSDLGSKQAFDAALQALDVDESQLLARIVDQERTLQLIDQRLRPQVSVSQSEIEAYYRDTFVPGYRRQNGGTAPPLSEVQDQIREILVQQKINQQLEPWLKELRSSRQVRVLGESEASPSGGLQRR